MSKNSWVILISTVIVVISIAIVLLLILIPQVDVSATTEEYQGITKSDYTYEPTKEDLDTELKEQYTVTTNKVTEGIKEDYYDPGNENPFTPDSYEDPNDKETGNGSGDVDPYKEYTPLDK